MNWQSINWRITTALLPLLAVLLVSGSCAKKTPTLNLLVWEGYADPSFVKAFEEQHHCKVTASYMGWGELKNGELLRMAEDNGFEVFVMGDQSLAHEQNLTGLRLAIVALSTNNWPIIKNHVRQILAAIDSALPGSFQTVNCGTFSRKKIPGPAGVPLDLDRFLCGF